MLSSKNIILNHRYRIVKPLAKGGFGELFEVSDRGKIKVLKVLNLAGVEWEHQQKAIALFQREAAVLQQLPHPGIPHVAADGYFTASLDDKTCHCLVMEKIPGENLLQHLQQQGNGTLTPELAIDWSIQLVSILHEIHQKGYFDRDIKPDNIMLKPDGKLVLIDFGAVRKVSNTYLGKFAEDREVTVLMSLEGYTPLEQIKGKAVPQSDFFAIARTMVHLLTGISPYELPENELTGELMWREKAPGIPEAFADLLDEMMAVFPRERPQSTAEILQRLKAISVQKPDYKPIKLRNFGLILGALMAAAFPIALLFTAPKIAVACNKRGVTSHKNQEITPAELYYNCAILFQRNYGKAHYNLGYLYEKQEKRDRAIRHYQIAIDYGIPAAYNNLARLLIFEGNCKEAVSLLEKGLAFVKKDSVKYALLANVARAKLCLNLHQEAKTYLGEAIAIESDRPEADCLLAPVLDGLGDKKGALTQLEKCPPDAPKTLPELVDWLLAQARQSGIGTETP